MEARDQAEVDQVKAEVYHVYVDVGMDVDQAEVDQAEVDDSYDYISIAIWSILTNLTV